MGVEGFFAELFRESMHNRYIQFILKEYDGKMEQKQQRIRLSDKIHRKPGLKNNNRQRNILSQQNNIRSGKRKNL